MPHFPVFVAELAVKVELLMLAHDAHTSAYNMEGISNVLRLCRTCSLQLNDVAEFSLMVCTHFSLLVDVRYACSHDGKSYGDNGL